MAFPRRAPQSIMCAGDVFLEGVSCSVGIHCKLPLVDLHDNMTAARYRDEVLMRWVEPHMDGHAVADRPIFQQDKAPPHIARLTTAFLQNAADDVLPWPSMSPDMNIIEHVWSHIASEINMMEHVPATAHDLREIFPRLTYKIWSEAAYSVYCGIKTQRSCHYHQLDNNKNNLLSPPNTYNALPTHTTVVMLQCCPIGSWKVPMHKLVFFCDCELRVDRNALKWNADYYSLNIMGIFDRSFAHSAWYLFCTQIHICWEFGHSQKNVQELFSKSVHTPACVLYAFLFNLLNKRSEWPTSSFI